MADSDALRSRRKRLHAAGDCSLCRHGPPGGRVPVAAIPAPGDAPGDPRSALEALWHRLEAAHQASPDNATLARELRMTLQALTGGDPDAGFDFG